MKPESARFVEQADIVLARAAIMLSAGLSEADYFTGADAVTSPEAAAAAIATARRFVAHFAGLI